MKQSDHHLEVGSYLVIRLIQSCFHKNIPSNVEGRMSRHEAESQPKGTEWFGRIVSYALLQIGVSDKMNIPVDRIYLVLRYRFNNL